MLNVVVETRGIEPVLEHCITILLCSFICDLPGFAALFLMGDCE